MANVSINKHLLAVVWAMQKLINEEFEKVEGEG